MLVVEFYVLEVMAELKRNPDATWGVLYAYGRPAYKNLICRAYNQDGDKVGLQEFYAATGMTDIENCKNEDLRLIELEFTELDEIEIMEHPERFIRPTLATYFTEEQMLERNKLNLHYLTTGVDWLILDEGDDVDDPDLL